MKDSRVMNLTVSRRVYPEVAEMQAAKRRTLVGAMKQSLNLSRRGDKQRHKYQ